MPDERRDSIEQGIGVPEESETGRKAAEERRRRAAEQPPMDGAMGGTSDADSPGEEAQQKAFEHAREEEERAERKTP